MRVPSDRSVTYFTPQRGEAQLWVLLTGASGPAFFAEEVYRLAEPGSAVRNGVPVFRDRGLADAFAGELAVRGTQVRVLAAPEPTRLTDLLVCLQDFGTTHVWFDPHGTALNLVTIERAIIGLYLFE